MNDQRGRKREKSEGGVQLANTLGPSAPLGGLGVASPEILGGLRCILGRLSGILIQK